MSYPSGPPVVEQHCYRHADRRAGVSCQRCSRPICPSCMVSASVGFQCPDCAKQGARTQRAADVFRSRTNSNLTFALIGVNALVYLVGVTSGAAMSGVGGDVNVRFGLARVAVADGEWWRLLTSGFLHAGLLHLGFNMFALYSLGGFLERVVGPVRFGLIYVVSLIGGSLGVMLLAEPQSLTVGASGAVFGVFAAFAVLQLSRGLSPWANGIGSTILLNLFITFAVPGISIGGHLGGLLAGAACGAVLIGVNPKQARERERQVATTAPVAAGLGIALFAAAIAVAHALPLS